MTLHFSPLHSINGRLLKNFSQVRNAIRDNDDSIYIIKFIIPLGKKDKLKEETSKYIIFSGWTLHFNNFMFDFTILGGNTEDCIEVLQLLQICYDGQN